MTTETTGGGGSYSLKEMVSQLLESVKVIDSKLDDLKDEKADKSLVYRLETRIVELERTGSVQAKEALEASNRNSMRLASLEALQLGRLAEDVRSLLVDVQKFREQNALTPMYLEQWNDLRKDVGVLKDFRSQNVGLDGFKRWLIPILSSGLISFASTLLVIYSTTGKL